MKKLHITMALGLVLALFSGRVAAQEQRVYCSATAEKELRREFYKDYSRWSLGVNGGLSAAWGDFRSFSEEKNYIGFLGGLTLGYQLTPTVGLNLSGEYGFNKMGAAKHNMNRLLDRWGFVYNGQLNPDVREFKDLYSRVNAWHIGLSADINVNNLFCGNKDGSRRWTVLVTPGIFAQKFDPTVKTKNGDNEFTTEFTLNNNWNFGAGLEMSLRYKATHGVDFALTAGSRWIDNPKFDGIASRRSILSDRVEYLKLGVIWKVGHRAKKDHLMYAPTRRHVKLEVPPQIVTKTETVYVTKEVPVEKKVKVEVIVKDLAMPLPTVHFERGNSQIDQVRYAAELQNIVSALRNVPQAKIQIWGFADHTGSARINDEISLARAQALRDYLVEQGIEASRITEVKGMGADPGLSGEEALSVKARRSEVVRD